MALTTTTLSGACGATDKTITVASATGFAAGYKVKVDAEFMEVGKDYSSGTTIPVLRGRDASAQAAHAASANVTVGKNDGATNDWAEVAPGALATANFPNFVRSLKSYSATGAIDLPLTSNELAIRILNGTSALAMTVAQPGKDLDGALMLIVGNGKSQSTITLPSASGVGNAGSNYDVLTLQNAGQVAILFVACNGVWCTLTAAGITGTVTALTAAIA